jgi:hypothetical protein
VSSEWTFVVYWVFEIVKGFGREEVKGVDGGTGKLMMRTGTWMKELYGSSCWVLKVAMAFEYEINTPQFCSEFHLHGIR